MIPITVTPTFIEKPIVNRTQQNMLHFFGNTSVRQGTYLLVIYLSQPQHITFGRFKSGKPVLMQQGYYLYAGSAMGNCKGADPLVRRLLRHATRSGGKSPHRIRKAMLAKFGQENPDKKKPVPPVEKKLRWHIDFLLDNRYASITGIYGIRSSTRHESALSSYIESLKEISVPVKGLGASDMKHETHLVFMSSPDECLSAIVQRILWLAGQDDNIQPLPINAPTNFERSKT